MRRLAPIAEMTGGPLGPPPGRTLPADATSVVRSPSTASHVPPARPLSHCPRLVSPASCYHKRSPVIARPTPQRPRGLCEPLVALVIAVLPVMPARGVICAMIVVRSRDTETVREGLAGAGFAIGASIGSLVGVFFRRVICCPDKSVPSSSEETQAAASRYQGGHQMHPIVARHWGPFHDTGTLAL